MLAAGPKITIDADQLTEEQEKKMAESGMLDKARGESRRGSAASSGGKDAIQAV